MNHESMLDFVPVIILRWASLFVARGNAWLPYRLQFSRAQDIWPSFSCNTGGSIPISACVIKSVFMSCLALVIHPNNCVEELNLTCRKEFKCQSASPDHPVTFTVGSSILHMHRCSVMKRRTHRNFGVLWQSIWFPHWDTGTLFHSA